MNGGEDSTFLVNWKGFTEGHTTPTNSGWFVSTKHIKLISRIDEERFWLNFERELTREFTRAAKT